MAKQWEEEYEKPVVSYFDVYNAVPEYCLYCLCLTSSMHAILDFTQSMSNCRLDIDWFMNLRVLWQIQWEFHWLSLIWWKSINNNEQGVLTQCVSIRTVLPHCLGSLTCICFFHLFIQYFNLWMLSDGFVIFIFLFFIYIFPGILASMSVSTQNFSFLRRPEGTDL